MRRLALLILVLLASGCIQPEPVETGDFSYSPPDSFSLNSSSNFENGSNHTYTGTLGRSTITVEVYNSSMNRSAYLEDAGFWLELSSSSLFTGEIENSRVDRDSEVVWAEANGTIDTEIEGEELKAREHLFSAYYSGKIYTFQLIDITEIDGNSWNISNYPEFRKSVKNSEFK
jgi:hypothetical protein